MRNAQPMSSSLFEQRRYTISNIKLTNPSVPSLKVHKRIFLIEIAKIIGGDNEPSKLVEGQSQGKCIVWSEQILYNVTADFTIRFKILMKKDQKDKSEIIGEYTTNAVSQLLDRSSGVCNTTLGKKSQLNFAIKEDRFKDMLDIAKQKSKDIYFAEGKAWSTFFTYLGIVKTAIDPVASLNPLVQQIWSIVSMVPNISQANQARTVNIKELLEKLLSIYEYIDEVDRLSVLRDTRTDQLRLLIDKTCECAKFIKDYTENNPATNFIKGPVLDDRISEFKKSFDQIMEHNRDILLLDIASDIVSNLLGDIPYASDVGRVEGKKCLPGTREMLLKEIEEWVNKDTTERVLILSGQAGTGKSAVARTIAKNLNNQLGSFFCFSRTNKELFKFLFSTISRNVADRNVLWKRSLVQAVKDVAVRKSPDPETQFNEMIIKPSKGTTKRMVIIIDALDESGDQKERKILLRLLFERSSDLPSNYRIIITSRPEHDIKVFHQHRNVCCKYMADVDSTHTLNDIQKVISYKLSGISETLDTVDTNWRSLLAQRAQRLFIWAKIACDYILELDGLEAAQRLRIVLSKSTSSLYEMYHRVLDAQPSCQSDHYLIPLKKCVGAVIVSRKLLSVSDLQEFFGPDCGDGKNVQVVLKLLNSLFIGLDSQSTTHIRPIHTSVLDFFLSSDQKPGIQNRYYIDTSDQSYFTDACLRVMNGMLRFNICELETSHKRNRDVPDFGSRVAKAIPSSLLYACCFWGYHLEHSSLNDDLLEKINDLIRIKLLYLFEVLSLLAEVDHGRSGMQILINMTKDMDPELASLAAEASQFLLKFGKMMTECTPHLYISALPYISKKSFISSQFLPQYAHVFSKDVDLPISLRPQFKNSVKQRHPSSHPSALAFSPRNRQIAAGFYNGDLWVWDYITGEMLCQTSPNEEGAVTDIVFSLNGERVYCCFEHGGILIWEENTRNVLYESNEGIAPKECHSCYISPDGRLVAFRTSQAMIFYERETHIKPFKDIPVFCNNYITRNEVMFSSTGRFVGIQPEFDVLQLWDTQEKTFVSFVSLTKDHELQALSDNYIIVRVMCSSFQEVYDIQTGRMVRRFQKHSSGWTRRFSPNGEDLLLSVRNMCFIWNGPTEKDSRRFVGCNRLTRGIRVIALSPDATHIAAVHNNMIHVLAWDDLDREEIDNWEVGDNFEDEVIFTYKTDGAWHKGQHLVKQGDLQVLDSAGTVVLNTAPVVIDQYRRPLAEISPEDNPIASLNPLATSPEMSPPISTTTVLSNEESYARFDSLGSSTWSRFDYSALFNRQTTRRDSMTSTGGSIEITDTLRPSDVNLIRAEIRAASRAGNVETVLSDSEDARLNSTQSSTMHSNLILPTHDYEEQSNLSTVQTFADIGYSRRDFTPTFDEVPNIDIDSESGQSVEFHDEESALTIDVQIVADAGYTDGTTSGPFAFYSADDQTVNLFTPTEEEDSASTIFHSGSEPESILASKTMTSTIEDFYSLSEGDTYMSSPASRYAGYITERPLATSSETSRPISTPTTTVLSNEQRLTETRTESYSNQTTTSRQEVSMSYARFDSPGNSTWGRFDFNALFGRQSSYNNTNKRKSVGPEAFQTTKGVSSTTSSRRLNDGDSATCLFQPGGAQVLESSGESKTMEGVSSVVYESIEHEQSHDSTVQTIAPTSEDTGGSVEESTHEDHHLLSFHMDSGLGASTDRKESHIIFPTPSRRDSMITTSEGSIEITGTLRPSDVNLIRAAMRAASGAGNVETVLSDSEDSGLDSTPSSMHSSLILPTHKYEEQSNLSTVQTFADISESDQSVEFHDEESALTIDVQTVAGYTEGTTSGPFSFYSADDQTVNLFTPTEEEDSASTIFHSTLELECTPASRTMTSTVEDFHSLSEGDTYMSSPASRYAGYITERPLGTFPETSPPISTPATTALSNEQGSIETRTERYSNETTETQELIYARLDNPGSSTWGRFDFSALFGRQSNNNNSARKNPLTLKPSQ